VNVARDWQSRVGRFALGTKQAAKMGARLRGQLHSNANVSYRLEIHDCFRKALTAAQGRLLPIE